MKSILNMTRMELHQEIYRDRGSAETVRRYLGHEDSDHVSSTATVPMQIRTTVYESGSQGKR